MIYINKLTDNDDPIPITHLCKPERLGKDMTGLELHEFGISLLITFLHVQDGKLIVVNMNPDNGCPHIVVENPQKVLLYVWVKTDLAPIIPLHKRNETHDAVVEASRNYGAKPCFASISISCASKEGKLIPKCGGEYYAVLNEFEEI